MNGRTYCGHYRGHYLKSTLEYIYARYLDYIGVAWNYEPKTFTLSNGGSYKPDFQLSETEFVEIKGTFNYVTDKPRIDLFIADTGHNVTILQEKDLRELIKPTPFVFEHLKQEWKIAAKQLGMDTSGKNNPRYGIKLIDQTKSKISEKAKERMLDPVFRQKWEQTIGVWARSEENKKRFGDLARSSKMTVVTICETCKCEFEVLYRKKHPRRFCSHSCAAKTLFSRSGKEEQLLLAAQDYACKHKEAILNCKMNKIDPVLKDFYQIASEVADIHDKRTLTLYLLGKVSNRKELLKFFQSLAENVFGASANQEAEELGDKEPLG